MFTNRPEAIDAPKLSLYAAITPRGGHGRAVEIVTAHAGRAQKGRRKGNEDDHPRIASVKPSDRPKPGEYGTGSARMGHSGGR